MLINCLICQGDINLFDQQVSVLNCGHFFHANCLNDWINIKLNCPECRAQITRGAFASNIYPKLNQETESLIQTLKVKCDETANQLKSFKEKCEKHENEIKLLKILNFSLKQSKLY